MISPRSISLRPFSAMLRTTRLSWGDSDRVANDIVLFIAKLYSFLCFDETHIRRLGEKSSTECNKTQYSVGLCDMPWTMPGFARGEPMGGHWDGEVGDGDLYMAA